MPTGTVSWRWGGAHQPGRGQDSREKQLCVILTGLVEGRPERALKWGPRKGVEGLTSQQSLLGPSLERLGLPF